MEDERNVVFGVIESIGYGSDLLDAPRDVIIRFKTVLIENGKLFSDILYRLKNNKPKINIEKILKRFNGYFDIDNLDFEFIKAYFLADIGSDRLLYAIDKVKDFFLNGTNIDNIENDNMSVSDYIDMINCYINVNSIIFCYRNEIPLSDNLFAVAFVLPYIYKDVIISSKGNIKYISKFLNKMLNI